MTVTVSHSEAESFLQCQRRWLYGYGWNLTKKQHGTALTRGTAGHKVLEEFYNAWLYWQWSDEDVSSEPSEQRKLEMRWNTAYTAAFDTLTYLEQQCQVGDESGSRTLREMITTYFEHEPFVSQGYEVLAVEQEFTLEYDEEGIAYPFVVDLILRDPQSKIVVVDHKFQYDFLTIADMQVMPQLAKYVGSIRALGLPADYAVYNQLRYRTKKNPSWTDIVRQSEVPLTPTRIVRTFNEQVKTAARIIEFKNKTPEQQNEDALRVGVKMICKSCPFKDLCAEDLQGGNVKTLINAEYTQKTRRVFKPSELPED
jgi:hypothetical protein